MCNEAILISLTWPFYLIPDHLKTQYMCIKAFEEHSGDPLNVLGHFKIQEVCDDTISGDSYPLQCVPDWFVKQKQVNIWYDDNDYCNHYEIVKSPNGNKNARPEKQK